MPPASLVRELVIWQDHFSLVLRGLESRRIIGEPPANKSQNHHSAYKKAANLDKAAPTVRIVPKPLPAACHWPPFPPFQAAPGLAGTWRLMYMLIPKV